MTSASRRELLAWLFGAPFALSACKKSARPRLPEGGFVGQDAARGHRLLSGDFPRPTSERRVPILIVGGGVAGLSAAWRLHKAGVTDFELLEMDDATFGTSRAGRNAISAYPWGAHYVPCPLPHAKAMSELLVEMGAAHRSADGRLVFEETQLCRAPSERLFLHGEWYEGLYPHAGASTDDLEQLRRFQAEMATWGRAVDGRGRRAFAVPVAHGSDDGEVTALDRLSMAEWMAERGYTSPRLRWFVEYGCRDDYGCTLKTASAWAAIHYFASRLDHGHTQEFLTWPEGNARLCAHLAQSAEGRLRTDALVYRVKVSPPASPSAVEAWTFDCRTGKAEKLLTEQLILAVPQHVVARLWVDRDNSVAQDAAEFQTSPWLVANLMLKKRPRSRGFPEAWDNVLYDSPSLGYVVSTHQLDRLDPSTVFTYYLPFTGEDASLARRQLSSLTFDEAATAVIADLSRAHPDIGQCIERLDVWRWGHAMVRPRVSFAFGKARQRAVQVRGSVHFAHTDLSAIPLFEEAQYHGARAAEEVLSQRGVSFSSLL